MCVLPDRMADDCETASAYLGKSDLLSHHRFTEEVGGIQRHQLGMAR